MINKYICAFTVTLLMAALSSINNVHATSVSNSNTAENIISDTAITASIKSKHLIDSRIKALNIHVETNKGEVVLTGTTPNYDIKELAESIAKTTDGVKNVVSKLEVNDVSKDNKTAISDAAITAAIKSKYLADDTIKSLNINIETANGKVTLTGDAPSDKIKREIESIAKSTDGVKEVVNKVRIL